MNKPSEYRKNCLCAICCKYTQYLADKRAKNAAKRCERIEQKQSVTPSVIGLGVVAAIATGEDEARILRDLANGIRTLTVNGQTFQIAAAIVI